MTIQRPDLARTTLSVLFIGALIAGSLWILSPFLAAFVWATMIVVATWPMMRRVESAFGGRRAPAVAVMTLGLLAILIVPLAIALQAILDHADDLVALLGKLPNAQLPAAPEWLGKVPLVGERAQEAWNHLASAGMADLAQRAQTLRWRRHHLVRAAGGQLRACAGAVRADRGPLRGLLRRWRVLGRVGAAIRAASCRRSG